MAPYPAVAQTCDTSHAPACRGRARGPYPGSMTVDVELFGTERLTLPDGAELTIRQLQPDDKQLLADGLRQLTPETRYRRFFRPVGALSDRDLAYLTEID